MDGTQLERVVAIGEIGLDYYRKFGDRDSQVELFIRQLELAEKLSLPVIMHNRDAGSDVLEILRERLPKAAASCTAIRRTTSTPEGPGSEPLDIVSPATSPTAMRAISRIRPRRSPRIECS